MNDVGCAAEYCRKYRLYSVVVHNTFTYIKPANVYDLASYFILPCLSLLSPSHALRTSGGTTISLRGGAAFQRVHTPKGERGPGDLPRKKKICILLCS